MQSLCMLHNCDEGQLPEIELLELQKLFTYLSLCDILLTLTWICYNVLRDKAALRPI